MNWSIKAKYIIAELERQYRDKPIAELRKALRAAYPWGARENWPYKCWLKEQRLALLRHPEATQDYGELFKCN